MGLFVKKEKSYCHICNTELSFFNRGNDKLCTNCYRMLSLKGISAYERFNRINKQLEQGFKTLDPVFSRAKLLIDDYIIIYQYESFIKERRVYTVDEFTNNILSQISKQLEDKLIEIKEICDLETNNKKQIKKLSKFYEDLIKMKYSYPIFDQFINIETEKIKKQIELLQQ